VSKGLGLGLDERATQTIRGWHFNPAKDGTGHAVASWVTIETIFRLF
jgi:outer membrane biosynthesis protein TonB